MTPGIEELLPVIDRVVAPIAERMGRMETKLDQALAVKEDIAVHAAAQIRTDARLGELESRVDAQAMAQAKSDGQNAVIRWVVGLLATIAGGIAVAGGIHFAGWS